MARSILITLFHFKQQALAILQVISFRVLRCRDFVGVIILNRGFTQTDTAPIFKFRWRDVASVLYQEFVAMLAMSAMTRLFGALHRGTSNSRTLSAAEFALSVLGILSNVRIRTIKWMTVFAVGFASVEVGIFAASNQAQVRRIAASVISTEPVVNDKTIGNLTDQFEISSPVCTSAFSFLPHSNDSVAKLVEASCPIPATGNFVNDEVLSEGFDHWFVCWHNEGKTNPLSESESGT